MADAIAYENGVSTMPGLIPCALASQPRGYAYEHDGRFIHLFGTASGLWTISSGLTWFETANGPLDAWAQTNFAAKQVTKMALPAGTIVEGVWRPGLYWNDQIFQALKVDLAKRRSAEQALHSLVERMTETLLYIEPEGAGLTAYGPRTRELLILACTEVENLWIQFMKIAGLPEPVKGFKTTDYVKLLGPLHLSEYEITLTPYANVPRLRPFKDWKANAATKSLRWYDAYNKTKHNREANLSEATVERCLQGVAAAIILFCVRYGPFSLFQPGTPLSTLTSHLFALELVDPDPASFYLPLVKLPVGHGSGGMGHGETNSWVEPWHTVALMI